VKIKPIPSDLLDSTVRDLLDWAGRVPWVGSRMIQDRAFAVYSAGININETGEQLNNLRSRSVREYSRDVEAYLDEMREGAILLLLAIDDTRRTIRTVAPHHTQPKTSTKGR
jgi:hypothetical protein